MRYFFLTLILLLSSASAWSTPTGYSVFIHQLVDENRCYLILMNSPTIDFSKVTTEFTGITQIVSLKRTPSVESFGSLHLVSTAVREVPQALTSIEEFAFDVMLERERITPQDVKDYRAETRSLDPSQITYIEVKEGMVFTSNGMIAKSASPQRTMLRSVRGQKWIPDPSDPHKFSSKPYALPWMRDKGFAPAVAALKSSKYPIRYEFGRAASEGDHPELIRHNLSLLMFLAARDAVLHGIPLEQVAIDIHSTRLANTRLYQSKPYSFTLLSDGHSVRQPEHTVLTRPLLELLTQFKPWGYFKDFGKIVSNAPQLDPARAFVIYESLKRYQNLMLDLTTPRNTETQGALIVTDRSTLSRAVEESTIKELTAAGLSAEAARALIEENRRPLQIAHTWPEIPRSNGVWGEESAQLTFVATVEDMRNVKKMQGWLSGLVGFYAKRLRELGVANPMATIEKMNFFTVAHPDVFGEDLTKMGFEHFLDPHTLPWQRRYDGNVPDFNLRASAVQVYKISGRKLMELAGKAPALRDGDFVKEGYYEREYREYNQE